MEFTTSKNLSLGVELELQLIDLSDFDLAAASSDLLATLEKRAISATVTPELTESMIEISCGVFDHWEELRDRLLHVKDELLEACDWLNLGICGGGTHPFQRWQKRRIFSTERFLKVSELYGYLAKQFTVFGQHIHVGCRNGDEALHLLHALHRYIPHFIALSASSPFFQGADTQFESARLNSIAAFPMSGRSPFYLDWTAFCEAYFLPMKETGIVRSMKDFYWDIRPKPEYGTIELRVCDTPLQVTRASLLAAFLQALVAWLQLKGDIPREAEGMVYSFNRFQACRFGWEGNYVDPITHKTTSLRDSYFETLNAIRRDLSRSRFVETASMEALERCGGSESDSLLMKDEYRANGTLEDVVQFMLRQFRM